MKQPSIDNRDPQHPNDRIDPPWDEAERASEARHGASLYRRGGLTDESAAYWARKLAAGDPHSKRHLDAD